MIVAKQKTKSTSGSVSAAKVEWGTAPYNFVSLPGKAVSSPLEEKVRDALGDIPKTQAAFQSYIKENLSKDDGMSYYNGEIHLTITNETPCFIGGNGENKEAFFAPNGKPVIPGSTIRGMVKNLFKIITCGAMRSNEDFHDQRLYYRSMAAIKSIPQFGESYIRRLGIRNDPVARVSETGAMAGFLVRDGKKYYICPAQAEEPRPQGGGNNETPQIEWTDDGCSFFTGPMPKKSHHDKFTVIRWDGYTVPEDVITAYREDKRRGGANGDEDKAKDWDLFQLGKIGESAREFTGGKYDLVVPCYFTVKNKVVQDFGLGPFYRIPYTKPIREKIPADMRNESIVDFADAVFGRKEYWGGRVFFEDAEWEESEDPFLSPSKPHPLMSPNPTSFQLYLKSNEKFQALHWDMNNVIRGYKLYWHQACSEKSWRWQSGKDAEVSGTSQITPLKAGNTFHGKIRFRELTAIELGALLAVFDLGKSDNTLRYKLGQGKSLGLGTVKMTAELFIDWAAVDISDVLGSDGWKDPLLPADEDEYQEILRQFREYMKRSCDEAGITGAYEILQKELQHLLDWTNKDKIESWSSKVRNMRIDDPDKPFQHRAILETVGRICNDSSLPQC